MVIGGFTSLIGQMLVVGGIAYFALQEASKGFEPVTELMGQRNVLVNNGIIANTLDRIGPIVSDDLEFVTKDIQQVQDTLGPALVASNERSTMQVAAVSVGATILALILGFLNIAFISKRLREVIEVLRASSQEVDGASSQLSTASQNLASGSSQQAASIETTSASLEEMSAMTKNNAESAQQADNIMV